MILNPGIPDFKKILSRRDMIKIEEITIPAKGTGKYFGLECLPFGINRENKSSPVFKWNIKNSIIREIEGEQIEFPGIVILEGTLSMTEEEYSQWTVEDSYVINWALEKLGLSESQ